MNTAALTAKRVGQKSSFAIVGMLIWVVLFAGGATGRIHLTTIEQLFTLAPLVIVPLGFGVVRKFSGTDLGFFESLAWKLQRFGALLATAAFWFSPGALAGLLASGWLVVCLLAALAGAHHFFRGGYGSIEETCFAAAFVYLLVGGVGLVLSRLGAMPMHFAEPIVLLTAVHFHYTGFALPIMIGATGRSLESGARRARIIFCAVALVLIGSPALLAAGYVFGSDMGKVVAASLLAMGCVGLSGFVMIAARRVKPAVAKTFLMVSAVSLLFAMTLAGIYAVGEFTQQYWLLIPQMARLHGAANALGFSLCGLWGWTLVRWPAPHELGAANPS